MIIKNINVWYILYIGLCDGKNRVHSFYICISDFYLKTIRILTSGRTTCSYRFYTWKRKVNLNNINYEYRFCSDGRILNYIPLFKFDACLETNFLALHRIFEILRSDFVQL